MAIPAGGPELVYMVPTGGVIVLVHVLRTTAIVPAHYKGDSVHVYFSFFIKIIKAIPDKAAALKRSCSKGRDHSPNIGRRLRRPSSGVSYIHSWPGCIRLHKCNRSKGGMGREKGALT